MSWNFDALTTPEPGGDETAGMTSDPLKTLELKPRVVEALATVFDPEIPVNIYELGLIYDILIDETGTVGIRMTLTAPACPAAQTLPAEVRYKIQRIPGVAGVKLDIVWDPPWDRDRMSDAAKLQLGLL
jgi:FeS assembly SUF system protein